MQTNRILENNQHRRTLKRALALLCSVTILVTMFSLKFEALTLERVPMCGLEEHVHTEECLVDGVIACDMEEHVHTDACYQEKPLSLPEAAIDELSNDLVDTEAPTEKELVVEESVAGMIEAPVEELEAIDLVPMDDNDLLPESESNDITEDDGAEPLYFNLAEPILISSITKEIGLRMEDIVEVAPVLNEEELAIGVDALDGDWLVYAARDFTLAELAVVTADDILVLNMFDGVAISTPSPESVPAIQDEDEAPTTASEDEAATDTSTFTNEEEQHVADTAPVDENDTASAPAPTKGDESESVSVPGVEDENEEPASSPAVENEEVPADTEKVDEREESAPAVDDENEDESASADEGKEQPEDIHSATIDLSLIKTYPLSLNAMLTGVKQEGQSEQLTLEYDETLLEVVEQNSDHLITPIQSFEATQIIVNNGSRYELTLVNCALSGDETPSTDVEETPSADDDDTSSGDQDESTSVEDRGGVAVYPTQTFEDSTDYVKVSVMAPEGAFPEGTIMIVKDVEDEKTLTDIEDTVSEDFVEVKRVHAMDISFWKDGTEIEPLVPISVVISVAEIEEQQDAVVVHVDDAGETEVVDSQSDASAGESELTVEMPAAAGADTTSTDVQPAFSDEMSTPAPDAVNTPARIDEISMSTEESDTPFAVEEAEEAADQSSEIEFSADTFSVYAVVVTETIETKYIPAASGETWTISVGYGANANIPAGATLAVEEVTDADYLAQTYEALDGSKRVTLARFFDITILDTDGNEVQPAAPVQVSVSLDENADGEVRAMHFTDETVEVLPAREEAEGVVFDAPGFSVYGVVYTVDFTVDKDGKPYVIHMKGGSVMSLRQLLPQLGIVENDAETGLGQVEAFIEEIEAVRFSDESLVKVAHVTEDTTAGALVAALGVEVQYSAELTEEDIAQINAATLTAPDWALVSLRPFISDEALTITMQDGTEYVVKVTDAYDSNNDGKIVVYPSGVGYIHSNGNAQDNTEFYLSQIPYNDNQTNKQGITAYAYSDNGYVFSHWERVNTDETIEVISYNQTLTGGQIKVRNTTGYVRAVFRTYSYTVKLNDNDGGHFESEISGTATSYSVYYGNATIKDGNVQIGDKKGFVLKANSNFDRRFWLRDDGSFISGVKSDGSVDVVQLPANGIVPKDGTVFTGYLRPKNQYIVIYYGSEGGTINKTNGDYNYSTVKTGAMATPDEGKYFLGWYDQDDNLVSIALAPNKRTTEKCGIIAPTQKEAAKDGTQE